MPRATPLLSDALDEYLATRAHLAPNTLLNDRSVLQQFVQARGRASARIVRSTAKVCART